MFGVDVVVNSFIGEFSPALWVMSDLNGAQYSERFFL